MRRRALIMYAASGATEWKDFFYFASAQCGSSDVALTGEGFSD
jgi:hypothetical protein